MYIRYYNLKDDKWTKRHIGTDNAWEWKEMLFIMAGSCIRLNIKGLDKARRLDIIAKVKDREKGIIELPPFCTVSVTFCK